jgi:hypothetical protein
MKFSTHPFVIDKKYANNLRNKIGVFTGATNTRKAVFLTMITTYGIVQNKRSYLAQNNITMEELFEII